MKRHVPFISLMRCIRQQLCIGLLILCICLTGLLCSPPPAYAEVRTITTTGEYTMGEAETPLVAKERAAIQAMRSASEQAGVYLESITEVKNLQLTKDEIMVLTSAVLEVLDKKYTQRSIDTGGLFFTCTVAARVDTANIDKMKDRARDKQAVDTLKKVQGDYAKAQREIERLKQDLAAARTDAERKTVQAAVTRNEEVLTATQWFERGYEFQVNRKDYDSAIEAYTKGIVLDPNISMAYTNRGAAYAGKGQYERAIADYDRAISIDPSQAVAYYNRGNAYRNKVQNDLAIADYDRAIALAPLYFDAYHNRGNAYADKRQYERAIADYNRAITVNQRNSITYNSRGNAYSNIGQYERAIADFDQAITLDLRNANAYNGRGGVFYKQGLFDRAIADFDQAIVLDPRNDSAYYNRGSAYYVKGQYERAVVDYDRAISLDPQKFDAYYFKGASCDRSGRSNEAVQAFRAYIRYAPPSEMERIQIALLRIAALGG